MCAFDINDIQSLITQDKPDQGVRLQVNVIPRFKQINQC